MITSATTVNTVYGQSAVNSTTNNKADGASFAAAFANASSTPAKTSSTASADKVSISAQAQQASAQDDIEAEAQALAAKFKASLPPGTSPLGFPSMPVSNMTPSNQAMYNDLSKQINAMNGTEQMISKEAQNIRGKMATLSSWGDTKDFTESSLTRQMQVQFRALEIMQSPEITQKYGNVPWNLCQYG
jgi:hypothetical protein